jgi:Ca-activated chloride channel family protein
MLWKKLLLDRQANTPWQRLRRNLLLIVQLVILASLMMALARPYLPVPSVVRGSVVVLLDGSASMLATDVEPNRFEDGRNKVEKLISELRGDDLMTLILVGRTPSVLASSTNDKNELRTALELAEARAESVDWGAALALAAGAAQGFEESQIVIISDGGLTGNLPPVPFELVYLPVGERDQNLAVSSLAIRPTEEGSQLFAQINNHGGEDQQAILTLEADGVLFDSKRISVAGTEANNYVWDIPPDAREMYAYLSEQTEDYLAIDDEAWAISEGATLSRALITGEGNRFLETALSLLPNLDVYRTEDQVTGTDSTDGTFTLFIYDDTPWPETMPEGAALLINPQPSEALTAENGLEVRSGGVFSNTNIVRITESPLVQHVDWRSVNIREAVSWEAPWLRPVVEAEGGPLLLVGERDGQRIAVLTFRMQDSDLPLQIAFPILMSNIVDWLSPGRAVIQQNDVRPGDVIAISPGASTDSVAIYKPDGSVWLEEAGQERILFDETASLGIYQIELRDLAGDQSTDPQLAGQFAVNLFSPAESFVRPISSLQIGQADVPSTTAESRGQREYWPYLALLAVFLLVGEWWLYHQRGTGIRELIVRKFSFKSQSG